MIAELLPACPDARTGRPACGRQVETIFSLLTSPDFLLYSTDGEDRQWFPALQVMTDVF